MRNETQLRVFSILLFLAQSLAPLARGDTDAVSFPASGKPQTVGYFNGGSGWSFRPQTNIVVTQAGYDSAVVGGSEWGATATVTFWAFTNAPLVSYNLDGIQPPVEVDTNGVVYGRVIPLFLSAGKEYYVSLDLGSNSTSVVDFFSTDLSDASTRPFQPAPEVSYLDTYYYSISNRELDLRPSTTPKLLWLGPTFRFQLGGPKLDILNGPEGLVLAWPTNTPNYAVETATTLGSTSWAQVTNAPVVAGNRYTITNRWSDEARFFRLRSRP
jgi:hypothetical protein